jgi:hypothetical protein
MREGDVALMPVPQADGVMKNRPAIILREIKQSHPEINDEV